MKTADEMFRELGYLTGVLHNGVWYAENEQDSDYVVKVRKNDVLFKEYGERVSVDKDVVLAVAKKLEEMEAEDGTPHG